MLFMFTTFCRPVLFLHFAASKFKIAFFFPKMVKNIFLNVATYLMFTLWVKFWFVRLADQVFLFFFYLHFTECLKFWGNWLSVRNTVKSYKANTSHIKYFIMWCRTNWMFELQRGNALIHSETMSLLTCIFFFVWWRKLKQADESTCA